VNEDSPIVPKHVAYGLLGLVVLYAVVRSVFAAAARPFWYDELMTLAVSTQGTWRGIVTALRAPLDGQPPPSYLIESFALKLPASQEIALRVPSVIAFVVTLVCVFLYMKRTSGEIVGLLCASSLLATALFHTYAIEARPYSMVVACLAFALFCYDRVSSPLWTALFAVALASAQALHYLAFLAMFPFGLAEMVYTLRANRIRWSVWAALGFGMLPLAIFWPLLSEFNAYYGAHNWSRLYSILPQQAYGEVLDLGWHKAEIVSIIAFILLFRQLYQRLKNGHADKDGDARDLSQVAMAIGFLLLPFVAWCVVTYMQSGLIGRYVLSTVLGLPVALGIILHRANKKWIIAVGLVLAFVVGRREIRFWKSLPAGLAEVHSLYASGPDRLVAESRLDDLVVVVPSVLVALPVAHYASPSIAKRLVFVTQDPEPENPSYTDTSDKEARLYQAYSPLRVWTYADLTNGRRAFLLLLSDRSVLGAWLPTRLLKSNWSIRTIDTAGDFHLYFVEHPNGDSAPPK